MTPKIEKESKKKVNKTTEIRAFVDIPEDRNEDWISRKEYFREVLKQKFGIPYATQEYRVEASLTFNEIPKTISIDEKETEWWEGVGFTVTKHYFDNNHHGKEIEVIDSEGKKYEIMIYDWDIEFDDKSMPFIGVEVTSTNPEVNEHKKKALAVIITLQKLGFKTQYECKQTLSETTVCKNGE